MNRFPANTAPSRAEARIALTTICANISLPQYINHKRETAKRKIPKKSPELLQICRVTYLAVGAGLFVALDNVLLLVEGLLGVGHEVLEAVVGHHQLPDLLALLLQRPLGL